MSQQKQRLGLTDVVLRDAHQSLLATRMRTEDMLPVSYTHLTLPTILLV